MRSKLIILLIILLVIGWYTINSRSTSTPEPTPPAIPGQDSSGTKVNSTQPISQPKSGSTVTSTTQQVGAGRIVFGITDKAVNLDSVKNIYATIEGVRIHSPKKGWIDVSKTPVQFDLLNLRNTSRAELLADINISEDNYDMIRLLISDVRIMNLNGSIIQAKIPSNELKINSGIKVIKGKVSSVLLDFLADKSLHQTGDGKYIFLPVISVETKSETTLQISNVQGASNKRVEFIGGNTNYNANVGMDTTGNIQINGSIDPNADLEIMDDVIRFIPKKQ